MAKVIISSELMAVGTLYIDELGRAARHAIEALSLGQLVVSKNKRLAGWTDRFDTESPHYKLMLHIYAMLHEWFVDQLREKVDRGMSDEFERSIDMGACAFGYAMEIVLDEKGNPILKKNGKPRRIRVIHAINAAHVVEAFTLFAVEKKSPQWIGKDFNDRRVGGRTSSAPNTITDLLAREVYAGFEYRNKTRQRREPGTGKHVVTVRPNQSGTSRRAAPANRRHRSLESRRKDSLNVGPHGRQPSQRHRAKLCVSKDTCSANLRQL